MESWDKVKDKIVFLIHNINDYDKKIINQIPCMSTRFVDDIIIVFYIDNSENKDGKNLTIVTNDHLKYWKIPIQELDNTVCRNFSNMDVDLYEYDPITKIITDIDIDNNKYKIYESFTENGMYGGHIVDSMELKCLSDIIGSDFYFTIIDSDRLHIYPEDFIDDDVIADMCDTIDKSTISHNLFYFDSKSMRILLDDINDITNTITSSINSAS